jgi:hypothetical protein
VRAGPARSGPDRDGEQLGGVGAHEEVSLARKAAEHGAGHAGADVLAHAGVHQRVLPALPDLDRRRRVENAKPSPQAGVP